MTEFRPTMQERKKWAEHAKNLRVGDLVVLADPNNPRGHWPLGRILNIFEATDGVYHTTTNLCSMFTNVRKCRQPTSR